ncbi:hypothetical protein JMJ56_06890 [Belnapia sp. T18]|uniref:DUF5648 domain-containing protein n=1 Tax=Belnapia arida TaxID=2804533 RepID=A0ABS1U365_9PROT|nr:hypothetical protein [Belnapia arida]MBL6077726.1 hypothetical protein [Belnapia arida]
MPIPYVVYSAYSERGQELWTSNPDGSNARLLLDIHTGVGGNNPAESSTPSEFTTLDDGRVIFSAYTFGHWREAWITDGTPEGTVLLNDLTPAQSGGSTNPRDFVALPGGRAVSTGDSSGGGRELYVTDGTEAGTKRLMDIIPGVEGSNPTGLTLLTPDKDGVDRTFKVLFSATGPDGRTEPWVTDGTVEGTKPLENHDWEWGTIDPQGFLNTADIHLGHAVFTAESAYGRELFYTDGVRDYFLADVNNHGSGSNPSDLTLVAPGVTLFFADGTFDDVPGRDLFKAVFDYGEGAYKVTKVADLTPRYSAYDGAYAEPSKMVSLGDGRALFVNNMNYGYRYPGGGLEPFDMELWVTDGTAEGTGVVDFLNPGPEGSSPTNFALLKPGLMVFSAINTAFGRELYVSDGLTAHMVADLAPGLNDGFPANSNPYGFRPLGDGTALFWTDIEEAQLWRTDGTAAGTYKVGDVKQGSGTGEMAIGWRETAPPVVTPPVPLPPDAWENNPGPGAYLPRFNYGDNGDNILSTGLGPDTLGGRGGNDKLSGLAGDDKLAGGAGNDTIDGGADYDVAYYQGTRGQYVVTGANGQLTVTDTQAGRDGTDVLTNVESLHFANPLVFRFYKPETGTHFYTGSVEERDNVIAKLAPWYTYEGPAFHSADPGAENTSALYRFYKPDTGTHFYTASVEERDSVIAKLAPWYTYEGPALTVSTGPQEGYSAVFRFYKPDTGTHFYTASVEERDNVVNTLSNWYHLEGVAYYIPTSAGTDIFV